MLLYALYCMYVVYVVCEAEVWDLFLLFRKGNKPFGCLKVHLFLFVNLRL